MELKTDRLVLRPWRPDDAKDLTSYANNRKIWRNLGGGFPHPYTIEIAHEWIERISQPDSTHKALAIEFEGKACGGVGYEIKDDVYLKTALIGYWLAEPLWGRGLITEAVRSLTTHLFETYDLARIQACVFAWNPASGRVLEKAGFVLEGRLRDNIFKDGELIDELIYGLTPVQLEPNEN